jgi:hypothetical protein
MLLSLMNIAHFSTNPVRTVHHRCGVTANFNRVGYGRTETRDASEASCTDFLNRNKLMKQCHSYSFTPVQIMHLLLILQYDVNVHLHVYLTTISEIKNMVPDMFPIWC